MIRKKFTREIRDPVHVFIRLDTDECKVLDSRPFQRLRHIHQLALTYLVYPGATHRRFEHSLGVMELATRAYDVVTQPENIYHDSVRDLLPQHDSIEDKYWRRVLRMAALCHDLGHLPFSHGAEKEFGCRQLGRGGGAKRRHVCQAHLLCGGYLWRTHD